MKFFKSKTNWSSLLLAVWLIASGVLSLIPKLSFPASSEILAGLAIAAGICLLAGR